MTTTKDALPELPDAMFNLRFGYDASQMRDYALAALASKQAEAQASPAPARLSDERIIAAWNAQRTYHGGEPCKLGHLEFARAVESMVRGIGLDGGM